MYKLQGGGFILLNFDVTHTKTIDNNLVDFVMHIVGVKKYEDDSETLLSLRKIQISPPL